jgi:hypothetical protein
MENKFKNMNKVEICTRVEYGLATIDNKEEAKTVKDNIQEFVPYRNFFKQLNEELTQYIKKS